MSFRVHVDETHSVLMDDLPIEVWGKVEQESKVKWHDIYWGPAGSVEGGMALLRAAAAHLGVPAPTGLSPKAFFAAFETVKADDLPAEFEDGLPSQEAAPTTA